MFVLRGALFFEEVSEIEADMQFMRQALVLAQKGLGFVSPNPMVGAVIVRDGTVIGEGYHAQYGGLHAERNAFADCDRRGIDCTGASLYVTLEPCCHHGKQPPCTEAILAHGIRRVIIGSRDPNPLVAGKGVQFLREHGIAVTEDVLRAECDRINEIFFHYITCKTPFVTMKYAMTADGKIACFTGKSKWITGESAREDVQVQRLKHSAVMAGIGTVLADDPMLTCRLANGRNPVRILCDSSLRIPLNSKILQTAKDVPTMIAAAQPDPEKARILEAAGCRIVTASGTDGKVDLPALMQILGGELQIDSILLEGGAALNWSALQSGIVRKIRAYIAPKIFGGAAAKTPVGGIGVAEPDHAFMLTDSAAEIIGGDFVIESRVKYVHRNC